MKRRSRRQFHCPHRDAVYTRSVRPNLNDPVFLIGHPSELVPLAARNDEDLSRLDIFQAVAKRLGAVEGLFGSR